MQWPDNTELGRVVRAFQPDARLQSHWPLPGGVSAQMVALEIAAPGARQRTVVFRRHERDLTRRPALVSREFRLLELLYDLDVAELPVPEPLLLDATGELLGTPYMLQAFLPGETDFDPVHPAGLIEKAAAGLQALHAIDVQVGKFDFLERRQPAMTSADRSKGLPLQLSIFDMLEPHWPSPTANRQVLNHGDYWPGNLLWLNGRLSGIVDWEDASLADPLDDLANARLEFLWAYGVDAMMAFTEHYLRYTEVVSTDLPCWDLHAALRAMGAISGWGLEAAKAAKMATELEWFVTQAGAKLDG